jgi:hypothetical protein
MAKTRGPILIEGVNLWIQWCVTDFSNEMIDDLVKNFSPYLISKVCFSSL